MNRFLLVCPECNKTVLDSKGVLGISLTDVTTGIKKYHEDGSLPRKKASHFLEPLPLYGWNAYHRECGNDGGVEIYIELCKIQTDEQLQRIIYDFLQKKWFSYTDFFQKLGLDPKDWLKS